MNPLTKKQWPVIQKLNQIEGLMKTRKISRRRLRKSAARGGAVLRPKSAVLSKAPEGAHRMKKSPIRLTVNGHLYELEIGDKPNQTDPSHTLAYTLRETLGLTGTKIGCDHGACGCCTVLMDDRAVLSCMTLTVECNGKKITTIEGLSDPKTGKLDPLQQAFIDHSAFQCGFCTPGIVMSAKALLHENPSPTEGEVKEALSGNFCRCISHYHVLKAVMATSRMSR